MSDISVLSRTPDSTTLSPVSLEAIAQAGADRKRGVLVISTELAKRCANRLKAADAATTQGMERRRRKREGL
jgi:hypothetical protein